MINSFAEVQDFDEEVVDDIIVNYFYNSIRSYFKDKVDQNQVPFLNKFNYFPSEEDVNFIKETSLSMALDYCYPLLSKFIKEEEGLESVTSDVKIVLDILNDMSRKNIPKEISAGMLYYLIKHCYN
jgi:hypothetical protein